MLHETFTEQGTVNNNTVSVSLTGTSQTLINLVNTALGSTTAVNWTGVKGVTISAETASCRVAYGIAATASLGHLLTSGSYLRVTGNNMINAMNLINATGSACTLQITLESFAYGIN